MPVLLLDNFDSFTYNLFDYICDLGYEVEVVRNDALDFNNLDQYSHIVLSPGPGLPNSAGCMMDLIQHQLTQKPILGVCLGMQALAMQFGDELFNLDNVRHGIQMNCEKLGESILLEGLPQNFSVGLYHSWAISGKSKDLKSTSISSDGVIMSVENTAKKCFGVQFHPESIMTPEGKNILKNFLDFK